MTRNNLFKSLTANTSCIFRNNEPNLVSFYNDLEIREEVVEFPPGATIVSRLVSIMASNDQSYSAPIVTLTSPGKTSVLWYHLLVSKTTVRVINLGTDRYSTYPITYLSPRDLRQLQRICIERNIQVEERVPISWHPSIVLAMKVVGHCQPG